MNELQILAILLIGCALLTAPTGLTQILSHGVWTGTDFLFWGDDETMVKQGQPSDSVYLMLSGEASVTCVFCAWGATQTGSNALEISAFVRELLMRHLVERHPEQIKDPA